VPANGQRVRCLSDILATRGNVSGSLEERAVVDQRVIRLATLTACALLAVLLGGIILILRLLYPPLNAADLHAIASVQVRIQLQQAQSQLAMMHGRLCCRALPVWW
jgi:hypothetical protein